MAILVDELREYPGVALPFTSWCHMATDGEFDELHAFAARLGLRRAWFQRDHYDLPPHGRAAALAAGAQAVPTGELLLRMTGPRGDRARRRALEPGGGVTWLRGGGGPAVLRFPAGALVVVGGPPGAGTSALAARVVDGDRVPVLDPGTDGAREAVGAALAAGAGAVAVAAALRHGHRVGMARAAAAAGVPAHLVALDADADTCRAAQREAGLADAVFERLLDEWAAYRRSLEAASDPAPFASVTVLDLAAADRVRRVTISPSGRG